MKETMDYSEADIAAYVGDCPAFITKGEEYGAVYCWAVDVTVPKDWDVRQDEDFLREEMGVATREKVCELLLSALVDYQAVLDFAYCFLTKTSYEPQSYRHFHYLPVRSKVELLRELIFRSHEDKEAHERFECDLRRFLDIETICFPVIARELAGRRVWLRELIAVYFNILCTIENLSESLVCEFEDCSGFVAFDRIDPPLPRH